MNDQTATTPQRRERRHPRHGGVVCPSLVLAITVVCDRFGPLHEPGRAHVLKFCTTVEHLLCPRWSMGTPETAWDALPPQVRTGAGRSRL